VFEPAARFLKVAVPGILKPLRVLWNEVIGFVFLVFAVVAGSGAFRTWQTTHGEGDAIMRIILEGFFAAVMAFFGVSSFWRARKLGRS
jgi:hypothetical protein